jgi:hypothetical protein
MNQRLFVSHAHNDLIRATLAKYRGYEVKTEGIAFLIVFHEAIEAVYFAMEAQRILMSLDIPPSLLSQKPTLTPDN